MTSAFILVLASVQGTRSNVAHKKSNLRLFLFNLGTSVVEASVADEFLCLDTVCFQFDCFLTEEGTIVR